MKTKPILFYLTITFFISSCTITLPRNRILDEVGNPMPGAIFYYEITTGFKDRDPDFVFAIADKDGYAPPLNAPLSKFNWRFSYYLQVVAFAKGYVPFILYDHNRIFSDSNHIEKIAELKLSKPRNHLSTCPSRIEELEYPFADYPKIFAKAARPEQKPLREAFKDAYEIKCIHHLEFTSTTISELRTVGVPEYILKKFTYSENNLHKPSFKEFYLKEMIGEKAANEYFDLFYDHVEKVYNKWQHTNSKKYKEMLRLESVAEQPGQTANDAKKVQ